MGAVEPVDDTSVKGDEAALPAAQVRPLMHAACIADGGTVQPILDIGVHIGEDAIDAVAPRHADRQGSPLIRQGGHGRQKAPGAGGEVLVRIELEHPRARAEILQGVPLPGKIPVQRTGRHPHPTRRKAADVQRSRFVEIVVHQNGDLIRPDGVVRQARKHRREVARTAEQAE